MVQEPTRQVEEARTQRYERRSSSGSRFQERLRHSVQWADAAFHRHRFLIFTVPVQQLGFQSAQSPGHQELPLVSEPAQLRGPLQPPELCQLLQRGHIGCRRGINDFGNWLNASRLDDDEFERSYDTHRRGFRARVPLCTAHNSIQHVPPPLQRALQCNVINRSIKHRQPSPES